MAKRKYPEGFCCVCGSSMDGGFVRTPAIFGKTYDDWCFACWNVPKHLLFEETGERGLNSLEHMMEGGWSNPEAIFHIKAVKKFLKMRG